MNCCIKVSSAVIDKLANKVDDSGEFNMIELLICIDKGYLNLAKVMLKSIEDNNKPCDIRVHVFHHGLSSFDILQLKSFEYEVIGYEVENCPKELFPIRQEHQPQYITEVAYFRLLSSLLLPETIDRVLYLDVDTIILGSLGELWNINIDNYAIAAVEDMAGGEIKRYNRLHFHPLYGYFNSGVLLINLKYWRDNQLHQVFFDYIKNYPDRVYYHDQDVMNAILHSVRLSMPYKYNVQNGFFYRDPEFLFWDRESELEDAIRNPVVIHFAGSDKPWKKDSLHPYKSIFLKYQELLGFSNNDFPPIKIDYRQKIRAILAKCGLVKSGNVYREI